ncbi:hypothetical protein FH972_027349 [Carpinus fangiana]|uniref:Uncharacterized protein n=1 Tax=Carpinus fangiana TaxID=176857 RepID=A0A5N6Q7B9_9ROSI|nr:hypothetical protein FH972_027349 [Carpinus fangiana]
MNWRNGGHWVAIEIGMRTTRLSGTARSGLGVQIVKTMDLACRGDAEVLGGAEVHCADLTVTFKEKTGARMLVESNTAAITVKGLVIPVDAGRWGMGSERR